VHAAARQADHGYHHGGETDDSRSAYRRNTQAQAALLDPHPHQVLIPVQSSMATDQEMIMTSLSHRKGSCLQAQLPTPSV
jgi:hypothetical protein